MTLGVVGINDGISGGTYTYSGIAGSGTPISIPATALLSNDYGIGLSAAPTGSVTCVEVVNGAGAILPTSGGAGTIFQYTPGLTDNGVILLRYVPVSNAGVPGNITYVYVYVGTAGCPATPCNLVTDPGFESTSYGFGGTAGWSSNVPCWQYYSNAGGGMYSVGAATSWSIPGGTFISSVHPDPDPSVVNDHFVSLWEQNTPSAGAYYQDDAISETLTTPLIAGNSYTITFWAIEDNWTQPTSITFAGSNGPVIIPALIGAGTGSVLPTGLTDLIDVPQIPGIIWHEFTATFTPTANFSQLTILETPFMPTPLVSSQFEIVG